MTDSRVLQLLLDITGLRAFSEATQAAHYWLSLSVMLRALVALWFVACTLVFSVRAVRLALPGLGVPLRWSAMMGAGMWVSTLGFHALRGLDLFYLPMAFACVSALGAAAVFVLPARAPWRHVMRQEWRSLCKVARLFTRSRYWFVTSLFGAYVALIAVRSLILPPLGWDTITYHGPRAVHWLQTNQFTYDPGPGPYSFYRHFISGGEVLVAWAMLPFHSDLLANTTGIVQWLGVGAATWALARALGVREPFASASGGLVMLVPVLALEMNSGYVEAALNLALLNGIALAVHCLRKPTGRVAVAAAMSLGVAAGIKLPGAPPGVIVLAVLLVRLLFVRDLKPALRAGYVALAIVGAALPVLPWGVQAYAETGYPLSPMPVKVLGITLGVSSPAMEWYQHRPGLVAFDWQSEAEALRMLFGEVTIVHDGPGPPLGALSVIPLFMSLIGAGYLLRKRPLLGAVLTLAMAAPWLTHFSTGLSVPRLLWSVSVARYMIALLGMAIPVSFVWCKPGSQLAQTYRRILILTCLWLTGISLRQGFGWWELRELMVTGVVALVLGTLLFQLFRARTTMLLWQRVALGSLIFVLSCSALQLRRDQTRTRAYHDSYALHASYRYWADAVPFVDEPGVQHRIALTGGPLQNADNWFYYYFFGARFDNVIQYVPVAADGGVAYFGPFGDIAQRADKDAWLQRLSARHMTEVLTFPPYSIEQGWMDGTPERFEKLSGGPDWGLYRLRK
jgi:hypothetical protein